MEQQSPILELVESALDNDLSAEQVCRGAPASLPEVRRRLAECRGLAAVLDDLFPPHPVAGDSRFLDSLQSDPPASDDAGDVTDSSSVASSVRDERVGREVEVEVGVGVEPYPRVPGYRAEAVIGRGGMGVVYRAFDERLNRAVALKTLRSGVYATRDERSRFLREGRAMAALRHPHVVPVYDAGDHAGQPYFTMELVEGGSLATRLGGGPLAVDEAVRVVEAVATAIVAAHAAGIVHRDLKPANVLLATDGTPKVSDFGLVRSNADADVDVSALTLTGQRLGTPSYMAPEQASPRWGTVGPATDVYGIGAVLYETLTGRPPFRGESAGETERQLLSDDPVSPRRLNPRVPRDLETVCLKCLAKDPARRYASAVEVVDELRRVRNGRPVLARRTGPAERVAKWARRRPATAVATGFGVMVVAATVGAAVWAASVRAVVTRAAADDLRDATALQQQSQWDAADAALNRAAVHLGNVLAPDALRESLDRARRDQAFVRKLEEVRLRGSAVESEGGTVASFADIATDHERAFHDAGIGDPSGSATVAADRVRASPIRPALVAALDHWASIDSSPSSAWVLMVARLADPDPTGWRDRARDRSAWASREIASALVNDPAIDRQPASTVLMLAVRLRAAGMHDLVIPLLEKAQRADPASYWTNVYLGTEYYLCVRRTGDRSTLPPAARFLQAAIVARPTSDSAHNNLGVVLLSMGADHEAEGLAMLREAVRLNPAAYYTRGVIGGVYARKGRHADAMLEYDAGLRVRPADDGLLVARGRSLAALGRDDEALAAFARVLADNPTNDSALAEQKSVMLRLGRLDAYCDAWRDRLAAEPPADHGYWYGYAELCAYLGRADDYAAARRQLLDRFADGTDPRVLERVGRACLLAPVSGPDLERATDVVDRALATDRGQVTWLTPYYRFARALADHRAGRFAATVKACDEIPYDVLGPCPKLLAAMAHGRLGDLTLARSALAQGVTQFDWGPRTPEFSDVWIYHALRREAEAIALPDLPAFLSTGAVPQDDDGRIAMTGASQAAGRTLASATLWKAVLNTDTETGGALAHRALAVRAAVQVGCGVGVDAADLTDAQRAAWRDLARAWLSAELAQLATTPESSRATTRTAPTARGKLAALLKSSDLAAVRDDAMLQALPADERRAWKELWERVALESERER